MAFQKVEFEFPEDDDDNKMAIEETSAVEIDITGKKTAEDFAADEAPADKPESKKDSDDDDLEIEVVDDTPKADRNRKPSEPPEDVTDEELEKYSDQVQNASSILPKVTMMSAEPKKRLYVNVKNLNALLSSLWKKIRS